MSVIRATMRLVSMAGTPDAHAGDLAPGSSLPFGWSNCDFSASSPTGTDPITLLLQLLTSQSGDTTNGAYDVFEPNVGLGIPQGLIDTTSFTNIRNSCDWDTAAQLFFLLPEPPPAKDFFDKEILGPFGLNMITANDGRVALRRPRHPQKFLIGGTNQVFPVATPAAGSTRIAVVPIGVYTGPALATALQAALNGRGMLASVSTLSGVPLPGAHANFVVTYNTSTHLFNIQNSSTTFDLLGTAGGNPSGMFGWQTIGFTTWPGHTGVAAGAPGTTGDLAVGAFGGGFPLTTGGTWTPGCFTLDQGDVWAVEEIPTQDLQVTRVIYGFDYDWDRDQFTKRQMYIDAEAVNLGDALGAHDYRIQSKGMVSSGIPGTAGPLSQWFVVPGVLGTDPGGCGAQAVPGVAPALSHFSVDAATWSQLFALQLLDRYKYPPLRFRCKAKLGAGKDLTTNLARSVGTRMEPGDYVQFSYNIASVIADRELDSSTLSNRVFEIVSKKENWAAGCLELELLGFSGSISY